jgi:signal transduction histidine kinase
VTGTLDQLPDQHRTCVYRIIQEALTNCVRHASATRIHVRVDGRREELELAINDDGVGLDPERRTHGLGLRGIEERVRDLDGTMTIRTARAAGTTLMIRLPLPCLSTPKEPVLARTRG